METKELTTVPSLENIFNDEVSDNGASAKPSVLEEGQKTPSLSDDKESKEDIKTAEDTKDEVSEKSEETESEESKKKPIEKTTKEESSFNWDSDKNPYRSENTKIKSQLKNTRDYATRVNQENENLKHEYGIENGESENSEEKKKENQIAFDNREKASLKVAINQYGEDYLKKNIYGEDSKFKQIMTENPAIQARVHNSDVPVLEAIQVLKEFEFFEKYGKDLDKIPDKIRTEIESDLRKKITIELQDKLKLKGKEITTLSGVEGYTAEKEESSQKFNKPLSMLFDQ